MMRRAQTLVSVVLVATATFSEAQTASAPDETIVVTGQRISKHEAQAVARAYTRGILALPASGQYARWKSPICPRVLGLAEPGAGMVVGKVRTEALVAGARIGKATCKPNLNIIFSNDADRHVKLMLAKSGRLFERMAHSDQTQLTNSGRPVRWWYNARSEGADGHQLGGESAMLLNAVVEGGQGPGVNSKGNDQYLDGYGTTLIGSRIRSNFESAFVIVDLAKTEGRTVSSVAAYVSLVALAEIRMTPASIANETILTLFSAPGSLGDLSPYDRAFLKAVYSTPPSRDRREQAGAITATMVRLLANE